MEAYISELSAEGETLVIRFSGCDYNCPYCDRPELVEFRTDEVLPLREACAAIDAAGKATVIFSGGEPLLQRQALLTLLRHCRQQGLRTVVETNASKPETIRILLEEGLVDEFRVDAKAPPERFGRVTRAATFFKAAEELSAEFRESLRLLKERPSTTTVAFSTVVVPGLLYRKEDLLALASLLHGQEAPWTLRPFDPGRTLDPALGGVAPPTRSFLESLAGFIAKEHPGMDVKIEEPGPRAEGKEGPESPAQEEKSRR